MPWSRLKEVEPSTICKVSILGEEPGECIHCNSREDRACASEYSWSGLVWQHLEVFFLLILLFHGSKKQPLRVNKEEKVLQIEGRRSVK